VGSGDGGAWGASASSAVARANGGKACACETSALVIRGAGIGRAVLVETARAVVAVFAVFLHVADDCGGVPLVFLAAFVTNPQIPLAKNAHTGSSARRV
jgi:hypothetical protein